MIDGTEKIQADMKMQMMGNRFRAGHAKAEPIGDQMINAVRGAIWDAWERGLDNDGQNFYPRIPLLDREGVEPEVA